MKKRGICRSSRAAIGLKYFKSNALQLPPALAGGQDIALFLGFSPVCQIEGMLKPNFLLCFNPPAKAGGN